MSMVKEALISEFIDLAAKAVEYNEKIKNAKTFAKKEVYKKKLRTNNIKAAEILAAFDKVINAEAVAKQQAVGVIDETCNTEGRTEASDAATTSLE